MIEVLRPGLLCSIQDLGRHGLTHLGISPAGAADPLLLRLGNLLAGNPEGAAAIELTLGGGLFQIHEETEFCIAGELQATLDSQSCKSFKAWTAPSGSIIRVVSSKRGLHGYLCVAGGIATQPVLGSRSTHVPSGLGGCKGRELRKGDLLPVGDPSGRPIALELSRELRDLTLPRTLLRVTPGSHLALFRPTALDDLASFRCRVEPDSNRMGVRLSGSPIRPLAQGILSEGVPLGALQVTPSGEMILLGVDAQTTGGYPILASVIAVDQPSVGQLRPGDSVGFEVTDHVTARNLLMQREKLIYEFKEQLTW